MEIICGTFKNNLEQIGAEKIEIQNDFLRESK